jgi:signal transduction histidine kinase
MTTRMLAGALALPLLLGLASPVALAADDYGSPEEAQAMLENAKAALEADQAQALADFSAGAAGFKDRDLYPYCGDEAGIFTAHPNPDLIGKSLKDLQDKTGNPFGEEIYANAAEDGIVEVAYMWPRPGEEEPVEKIALVTKVGDQICAVGYYVEE